MPVMEVSGRPQRTSQESFVSNGSVAAHGRVPSVAVAGSNLTRFSSGLAETTRAILKSTGEPVIPPDIAPARGLPK